MIQPADFRGAMSREQKPIVDWKRVFALPHNPFFRDEVKECRKKLGLPIEGISNAEKADEWIHRHFAPSTHGGPGEPSGGNLLPHEMALVNKWIAEPSSMPPRLKSRLREIEPWEVEVPLVRCSAMLAYRFRVPLRMTATIMRYVLTDDCKSLESWGDLEVTFEATKTGVPQLDVTVKGIDAWTTKREWISAWEDVRLKLAAMPDAQEVHPKGKRVGRNEALRERMKRHSEWYELVERKNLSPAKAIERWEKQHVNEHDDKAYDPSTVAKSVAEFRRLIIPRKVPADFLPARSLIMATSLLRHHSASEL